jgi:uncharacterized protein (UPF0332 family)
LNPNASALLEKAFATLEQAQLLFEAGHYDGASDRAYYAMFYGASALLAQRGLQFRSHQGIHAAFGKEFAKSGLIDPKYHRKLLDAFELRQLADYGPQATIGQGTAGKACDAASKFLAVVQSHMRQCGPDKK